MDVIIRSYFVKYDKDEDGCISKEEFEEVCYDLGFHIPEADIVFTAIDADQDEKIEYDEFKAWLADTPVVQHVTSNPVRFKFLETAEQFPEWMEWSISTFRSYDPERLGYISHASFEQMSKDYPFPTVPDWSSVDLDHNQQVSFKEFMRLMWDNYDVLCKGYDSPASTKE
mmetsp:Transcript_64695/g.140953  ORF Transcript_64695/g.140953 Transcript_64695/m.140953 type:complete len:170 (-) Transcript_64695:65-574(-)